MNESSDLCERVVAYEQGVATIAEVADCFAVGQSVIKNMLRQKRETGSLTVKQFKPDPEKIITVRHLRWLARD